MSDNPDEFPSFDIPFADSFSPDSRRRFIEFTVSKLISAGLSKTQSLAIYRDSGVGITRNDFNTIYDKVSNLDLTSSQIQNIPNDVLPTTDILGKANFNLKQRYMFTAAITYDDIDAEVQGTKLMSVFTSRLMTKDELIEEFERLYGDSFNPDSYNVLDITVIKGYKR